MVDGHTYTCTLTHLLCHSPSQEYLKLKVTSLGRSSCVRPNSVSLFPFLLCDLQGELLSPCRCDGSVRCTHQPCLIRWISERGSWSCELCYFKYQVLAISTKNPLQVSGWDGREDCFANVAGYSYKIPSIKFIAKHQNSIKLLSVVVSMKGHTHSKPVHQNTHAFSGKLGQM